MKNFIRGIAVASILFIAGIGLYTHSYNPCALAVLMLITWLVIEGFNETNP